MADLLLSHRVFLRRYVHAIWDDGVARMGSGLGVIFAFLAVYFGFIAGHNIAVLWLLALLSFLFASYRVWVSERKQILAMTGRPKLAGLFHDIALDPYPYEDDGTGSMVLINPRGTQIAMYVRILNENPTPTTLHNFSLLVEMAGESFYAAYPEDWEPGPASPWWTPAALAERDQKRVNLVSYLGNPEKRAVQGAAIEGCLVFRLERLSLTRIPWEPLPISLTLYVQDAWGVYHYIKDLWGSPLRPSLRLTS